MEPASQTAAYTALGSRLSQYGLRLRGGFHPNPDEGIEAFLEDRRFCSPVRSVLIIGNVGSEIWSHFSDARERGEASQIDPLDSWVRVVVSDIAEDLGAGVIMPSGGPPYPPFQGWAMRADDVSPSPLGLLIHPVYGLWHAYRAALALSERWPLPIMDRSKSPCSMCETKPCLITCPVSAFDLTGYDVVACRNHVSGPDRRDCRRRACAARRACPVGQDLVYSTEQALFHMESFLGVT